jgi:hypothetical protein
MVTAQILEWMSRILHRVADSTGGRAPSQSAAPAEHNTYYLLVCLFVNFEISSSIYLFILPREEISPQLPPDRAGDSEGASFGLLV